MDIVERLRVVAAIEGMPDKSLAHEAAAEIERLRAELKARDGEIADWLRAEAKEFYDFGHDETASSFGVAADAIEAKEYRNTQKTV